MSNTLNDGTVIPSYFGVTGIGDTSNSTGALDNVSLRLGEVLEIFHPEDDGSVSKRFTEYTVEVQHRDGSGPSTSIKYFGCITASLFGTSADSFQYSLRANNKDKQKENGGPGNGSKVLLACINGSVTRAVILHALRDTGTDKDGSGYKGKDKKEDGHNLFFEFNGLRFTINNDGETTIMFRGATKVDGSLTDDAVSSAEGTYVKFDKEGNLTLSTPEMAQFIKMNHKDKKIEIGADEHWRVVSNKKITISCQEEFALRTEANKMDIEAKKKIYMKSEGVHVGSATDKWPLFSTYRDEEHSLHNSLKSDLDSLSKALDSMSTNLMQASIFHKIPYTGAASGASYIQNAGIQAQQASVAAGNMKSDIESFESKADKYLSKKNKND